MLSCGSLFSDRRPTLVVMSDVTQLLSAIDAGDPKAADQLLPLVYEELRKLAAAKMAQEQPGQTLQPTALVHEAWLRLVGDESARFEGRAISSRQPNARTPPSRASGLPSTPTAKTCLPIGISSY